MVIIIENKFIKFIIYYYVIIYGKGEPYYYLLLVALVQPRYIFCTQLFRQ
jgi:hypothetical protein